MSPYLSLIVISGYLILVLIISLITSKNASADDFYVGSRKSPWYVVSFGMLGTLLSGVTFISVPGWVSTTNFTYMQMVLGFATGYIVVAHVLLPVYYSLNLTSIYTFLEKRFGSVSYKTGASFFLISRTVGASVRLYLMATVLHVAVFSSLNISFYLTVVVTLLLIWLYTFRGGIKTIIWTDTLQTLFMLTAVLVTIFIVSDKLGLSLTQIPGFVAQSDYSRIFEFSDFSSKSHFLKQFFNGIFITIVMSGLDQDIMQKNLSCKNIGEAKKNMKWYGFALIPVNLIFLVFGVLLYAYAAKFGITASGDELYPEIAFHPSMPAIVGLVFLIGLIAAAYSSADSALTSLTTAFSVDILLLEKKKYKRKKIIRILVHLMFSVLIGILIVVFYNLNNKHIIDVLYKMASYTYGPLLGIFAAGLFARFKPKEKWVPVISILAPAICGLLDFNSVRWFGFAFGYEILLVNGFLTFLGLYLFRERSHSDPSRK